MKNKKKTNVIELRSNLITYFWYAILLLYLELCLSLGCFQTLRSLPYIITTSLSLGIVLYSITNICRRNGQTNPIIYIILTAIFSLLYVSQVIYYKIFATFYTLTSLTMVKDASQYSDIFFQVLSSNWVLILIMLIPLLLSICLFKIFASNLVTNIQIALGFLGLVLYIVLHILLSTGLCIDDSDSDVYNNTFLPATSYEHFGAVISLHSDIAQLLGLKTTTLTNSTLATLEPTPLSLNADGTLNATGDDNSPSDEVVEIDYKPQTLDIDFSALAAAETDSNLLKLHNYFSTAATQNKNEYTGMFEGYNLIFLTAESFSHYCIDEELTPTLYRMYNEGFQFTDFYTPGWSVSTTDGEYVALTGLIPKSGVRSFTVSANNYLPFTMGMQTTAYGYSPIMAYHNHTYDYYSRDLSHPNMGYNYKALGLGLDVKKTWPESDYEMMTLSANDYIHSEDPFHAYYMTVSGHQLYNFTGNYMSYQNKSYTDHLSYSEPVRAYLSANIELDLALEYLVEQLESVDKLDKTLFVLSADHYPYGLTLDQLAELNGAPVDDDFGKYQNAFLIWSASMEEPIVIDKPAQSLDIIPTISNLLGFDYDSRLLMGNDILGDDYSPLVIFSNRSFITNEGRYNARTGAFTENEGIDKVSSEYVESRRNLINAKFEVSQLILDTDYYRKVLD